MVALRTLVLVLPLGKVVVLRTVELTHKPELVHVQYECDKGGNSVKDVNKLVSYLVMGTNFLEQVSSIIQGEHWVSKIGVYCQLRVHEWVLFRQKEIEPNLLRLLAVNLKRDDWCKADLL